MLLKEGLVGEDETGQQRIVQNVMFEEAKLDVIEEEISGDVLLGPKKPKRKTMIAERVNQIGLIEVSGNETGRAQMVSPGAVNASELPLLMNPEANIPNPSTLDK